MLKFARFYQRTSKLVLCLRIMANLEGSAGDLRVLEVSGAYQFCAFECREGGAVIGRIVADSIKSSGDARLLASSAQAR